MPSPFPGMDPYLESHWRDVHASLVIYSRDALQACLPPSLRARVEERVLLETPSGIDPVEYPAPRYGGKVVQVTPDVASEQPLLVDVEAEPLTETFIEIIDRESGNRVVTVIEFLSPTNKVKGKDHDQYLSKQQEILASNTNLVEIDLVRVGYHTVAFPQVNVRPERMTPYIGCVRRATRRDKAEVWLMPLTRRLPVVKIPLRPEDADVPLDLQALVDQCYRNGGYEGTLDYKAEPEPPLGKAEAAWVDQWLREEGLRPARRRGNSKRRRGQP